MKKQYRVSFQLGNPPSQPPPPLGEFAALCYEWVRQREGVQLPDTLDPADCAQEVSETHVGEGMLVRAIRADSATTEMWGLRFDHRDQEWTDITWSTRLCWAKDRATNTVEFSCSNSRGLANEKLVRAREQHVTRPRIVPAILERYGGRAGLPLSARPVPLDADGASSLVEILEKAERARPIVLVSLPHLGQSPLVEADRLADQLAGLANVVIADHNFHSADPLPRQLGCWGGAVRLYWPGFRIVDPPHVHPYWAPDEIRALEQEVPHGLTGLLLAKLGELGATTSRGKVSWRTLELARLRSGATAALDGYRQLELQSRRQHDELLKESRQWEDLAEQSQSELGAAQRDLQIAEAEIERLQSDLDASRNLVKAWKQAWRELRSPGLSDDESPARASVPVESLNEAVDLAKECFGERLEFVLKNVSKSYLDENVLLDRQMLFNALHFLATDYFDLRKSRRGSIDLNASALKRCGMTYRPNESKLTMHSYPDDFRFLHEGHTYWLEEHLRKGTSFNKQRSLRIGFGWCTSHQKVLVGFIGQHQDIGRH